MNQEHSVVLCSLAQEDLLKNRCARALGTAGLALMLGAASFGVARAESAPVGVPDKSFPEGVTSTEDGTLYVGSFNLGGVTKVRVRQGRTVHQARHRRQPFHARSACRRPGGTALEVWATDPLLAPAKDGVGLDGIAFGADGNLYVTTYIPAALFKITVKDGKAGAVTALRSSRPLDHADAMRGFGDSLLLIEGNGKLDKITIKGDDAEIETIKDGFTEPVSVTQVGDTAWVAEGKLSYIIGDNKGKDPGPFTLKPFSLSK